MVQHGAVFHLTNPAGVHRFAIGVIQPREEASKISVG